MAKEKELGVFSCLCLHLTPISAQCLVLLAMEERCLCVAGASLAFLEAAVWQDTHEIEQEEGLSQGRHRPTLYPARRSLIPGGEHQLWDWERWTMDGHQSREVRLFSGAQGLPSLLHKSQIIGALCFGLHQAAGLSMLFSWHKHSQCLFIEFSRCGRLLILSGVGTDPRGLRQFLRAGR